MLSAPPLAAREPQPSDVVRLAADTIRVLAAEAVQQARSGHPGMPMGMADAATVLWTRFLEHDPSDPAWWNRDRFVLSAGHGSMLLYALLHLSRYDLPLDALERFRQLGSVTPGHPERSLTPGVETTTGPLGQGLANAVGMALAERWLARRYNRPGHSVIGHRTWVIASDGDLMEGISHEAGSLAGHLGLGRLIVLYDDNGISIDGPTSLSFSEDVLARFVAYGWRTDRVDGHDPTAVEAALLAALGDEARPSLIACRTRIGRGSPGREGTAKAHGEPLGDDELLRTKAAFGWPLDVAFHVPDDVYRLFQEAAEYGTRRRQEWQRLFERYEAAHPDAAAELRAGMEGRLPADLAAHLPYLADCGSMATRAASGAVLDALWAAVPMLVGGSADLTPSNNTKPKAEDSHPLERDDFSGRYIHFGVREHGMGAIMNGLALHGGVRPFGGTFLVFSDYMRPSIRLAALMGLPVIYVFTHDSIALGEDGPTHQPIEHLTALRAMPNLWVIRPADATETVEAWRVALERRDGPTTLILTRQPVPTLDRTGLGSAKGVHRGGYVLAGSPDPELILIATGSEVHLALEARGVLAEDGVRTRVVSMPSRELFELQSQTYKQRVLPAHIRTRVVIEAGATLGWHGYAGLDGAVIGIDRFGESAPGPEVYRELGMSVERVVEVARRVRRADRRFW